MRVLIQWSTSTPQDWVLLDAQVARDVRNLPRKPAPTGGETIDNTPGWVCAVNCQGIIFHGYDHVGFEIIQGTLAITGWQDDPDDFGTDVRWATRWRFGNPAPDPLLGGQVNTVQERTVWATPDAVAENGWTGVPGILPWTAFAPPPANMTLHGVWLPDALHAAHVAARSMHGWREWVT